MDVALDDVSSWEPLGRRLWHARLVAIAVVALEGGHDTTLVLMGEDALGFEHAPASPGHSRHESMTWDTDFFHNITRRLFTQGNAIQSF